jgi:hypothetical protein
MGSEENPNIVQVAKDWEVANEIELRRYVIKDSQTEYESSFMQDDSIDRGFPENAQFIHERYPPKSLSRMNE